MKPLRDSVIRLADNVDIPTDIICNGFNIRQVVVWALETSNNKHHMNLSADELNNLSQEVTDALAISCKLKN